MMCLIGLLVGGGAVETVTTAVRVTVAPLAVVPVAVKVVVAPGETATDPEGSARLLPTPLSMESDVMLLVVQVSVELCPGAMVEGAAVKFSVACVTVIVAWAVAFGAAIPVAVMVNVVVCVGTMVSVPESAMPSLSSGVGSGEIETDVALVVAQVSVAGWPERTVVGEIVSVTVGAWPAGGFVMGPPDGGGVDDDELPPLQAVRKETSRRTAREKSRDCQDMGLP